MKKNGKKKMKKWKKKKGIVILVSGRSSIHLSHKYVNFACHVSLKNAAPGFL
jgi:formate dehydrogenase assembly factor FdhD